MRAHHVGRWLSMCWAAGIYGLAAISCGTTAGSRFADAGLPDGSLFGGDASFGDSGLGSGCTPRSCMQQGFTCGQNGDGCSGVLDCGTCTAPEFCGGGGYSRCGTTPSSAQDGGAVGDGGMAASCSPTTCEDRGFVCGWASDGCGSVVLCGQAPDGGAVTLAQGTDGGVSTAAAACPSPTICGGPATAPTPNVCSGDSTILSDGANTAACTPKGCPAGANCGQTGDGCGNVIQCPGECTNPQTCGGGGQPNVCGGFNGLAPDGGVAPLCTPTTCAVLGYQCGPAGDGCGNLLDCGSCLAPSYCGGGGQPNVCGGNVNVAPDGGPVGLCPPTTCAAQNISCGQASDGCGNVLQCGVCVAPDTCGGGGSPGVCGHTCTGLCSSQAACDGGAGTTITGTVQAPISAWLKDTAGYQPDPVPNVLVYIPNAPLAAIGQGYSTSQCPSCGADVSGSPLVSTYTNFDGTFTLTHVPTPPAGTQTQIPIVIQLGRWRKEFLVNTPAPCGTTSVGALNLPSNKTDGVPASATGGINTTNIPLTAISTGNVDALECVLLKMGVDQAEFTANTGTGRIHIYAGDPPDAAGGGPGATVPNANPEATLMNGTNGTYMAYDQIMFPCWGAPFGKTADELTSLSTYADHGGHFFATHFSYTWLYTNGEFANVATWNTDYNNPGNDVSWTLNVSTAPPVVPPPMNSGIFYKWLNLVGALSPSSGNPAAPPANPLVKIASPRHDADGVANGSVAWIQGTDPNFALDGGSHASLVEHFTFDTPVGVAPQCGHAIFSDFHVSNEDANYNVAFPKECGTPPSLLTPQERILEYMIFDLASCVSPPASNCTPLTCADEHLQCGVTGDGCGNTIDCGRCVPPLTCGGGGVRGVCDEPEGGACTTIGCNGRCGPQGDGCGGQIACPCPAGTTCGGGGVPNQCGVSETSTCVPQDCAAAGISCGPAGDGCGGLVPGGCGPCASADGAACAPRSCADQHIACGPTGDGCGNLIASCGVCTPPQTCGGGGVPGQCGGDECSPYTCTALGFNCGPAGDGCGGLIQCGTCPPGEVCGATLPGHCGVVVPK